MCVRHYSRTWNCNCKQSRQNTCIRGAYTLVEEKNNKTRYVIATFSEVLKGDEVLALSEV